MDDRMRAYVFSNALFLLFGLICAASFNRFFFFRAISGIHSAHSFPFFGLLY
jgi:hypothetical protein